MVGGGAAQHHGVKTLHHHTGKSPENVLKCCNTLRDEMHGVEILYLTLAENFSSGPLSTHSSQYTVRDYNV